MSQSHFPSIGRIPFEGSTSKNPFAFKHYNADELVEGRPMREHLRFSVVYWHTMCGLGADMFGGPTAVRPWDAGKTGLDLAKARVPDPLSPLAPIRSGPNPRSNRFR
jgi:xylose isomerase